MKILAVGAHFDDVEIGCGGTIAKHVANGDFVVSYILTNSAYTNHDGKVYRTAKAALAEGKAAAKILGIKLERANFKTKRLEFTTDLVESINKIIDKYNIDTVYTHWHGDVTHDHVAAARATLTACRHVPNVLMYRSNFYTSFEPFKADYFVDVTDYCDIKVKAIKANKTEYKRRGDKWIDFFLNELRNNGLKNDVEYAESFQIVKLLK